MLRKGVQGVKGLHGVRGVQVVKGFGSCKEVARC